MASSSDKDKKNEPKLSTPSSPRFNAWWTQKKRKKRKEAQQ